MVDCVSETPLEWADMDEEKVDWWALEGECEQRLSLFEGFEGVFCLWNASTSTFCVDISVFLPSIRTEARVSEPFASSFSLLFSASIAMIAELYRIRHIRRADTH